MLSIKMIKFNYLIFAFLLSIFVHVVFVYQIQKINKVDEIYVLDLSTYKEFKPKKVEVKKQVTKDVPKPEKKIIQKKIFEKKLEQKVPIKERKVEIIETPKPEKQIKELEKKVEPKNLKNAKENDQKIIEKSYEQKKTFQSDKNRKLLIDQEIKSFLIKISEEINKIAIKSYPIQSIKRREQGTIIAIIILNSNGDLLELNFENKRPKRLYEKTKQILKSYEFPKPPQLIFNDTKTFSIKIPVNYILN